MVLRDNKHIAYLSAGAALAIGSLICLMMIRHVVPVIVGLAFIGFGAFVLFRTKRVTIELDRGVGTIHILLQGLNRKVDRNLGLAQIQKLLLRKLIQTHTTVASAPSGASFSGGRNTTSSTTTYHRFVLAFVTDQNEEIPFEFGKVKVGLMNMMTSSEEKIRRNVQEVANFLNVPVESAMPSTSDVRGGIRAVLAGYLQKVH